MAGSIELRGLTKRFGPAGIGGILAVDNVTFNVRAGEVLGFLGPNGAGKSTTMKMVTGFIAPTSGSARVCGHDVVERPLEAKRCIGYLPEGAPAYPDMTPLGFLSFIAQVRGLHGTARTRAIDAAIEAVKIDTVLRQPIETLSKGFKRRVGLAQAILHDPEVLIMDEPTDGLDPNQKHDVRNLIRAMANRGGDEKGKAIILSTHILEEVQAVCTRVVLIAKGKVAADCTPAELAARSKYYNAVTLTLSGVSLDAAMAELKRVPGVRAVERSGATGVEVTAIPTRGRVIAHEVGELVRSKGWQVDQMRVDAGSLDGVFRDLTLGASMAPANAHEEDAA